uniref:Uncharacterized protein n=1 Tax=Cacopsylla melanoneura TaxID=428564 RepID=A0A8D9ABZ9_9HEMI
MYFFVFRKCQAAPYIILLSRYIMKPSTLYELKYAPLMNFINKECMCSTNRKGGEIPRGKMRKKVHFLIFSKGKNLRRCKNRIKLQHWRWEKCRRRRRKTRGGGGRGGGRGRGEVEGMETKNKERSPKNSKTT